ncbi:MAG: DUF1282 family protein [Rhodocyclaceae bacterium]|nr:DUF1282 family protein [Rhodocyclaceae bacterium]
MFSLDPRMVVSSTIGWPQLRSAHPTVQRLFLGLVLPFSLVPAIMLLYAGYSHGQALVPGSTLSQWEIAAAVFLLAELITVPLMARLLRDVLGGGAVYSDCYALAAYAAIPMWLSSLGLLSSSLPLVMVIAALGLIAAFMTLFHGLTALFGRQEDEITSQYHAYLVLAAGACGWLLLVAFLALMLGIFPW